ncbi:MAG: hypothetical protein H7039_04230 [Bryobacteraceae bacterium]|nr:hypothetical protein [Bryobacteraceae bacterium]
MSSEFPPIIIDGTCLTNDNEPNLTAGYGAIIARSQDFGKADANGVFHIRPSLVSLYLIRDGQLLHQGDYKSEQIELIWGSGPDEQMAVGGESMTLHGAPVEQRGTGLARIGYEGAQSVQSIRIPDRKEPLELGKDFQNFIVILQRRR